MLKKFSRLIKQALQRLLLCGIVVMNVLFYAAIHVRACAHDFNFCLCSLYNFISYVHFLAAIGASWPILFGGHTHWTVGLVGTLISFSSIIAADTFAFLGGKVFRHFNLICCTSVFSSL